MMHKRTFVSRSAFYLITLLLISMSKQQGNLPVPTLQKLARVHPETLIG
jgi:hypothetical protein